MQPAQETVLCVLRAGALIRVPSWKNTKLVQHIKTPAAKPDNLSWIYGTHKGEKQLLQAVL